MKVLVNTAKLVTVLAIISILLTVAGLVIFYPNYYTYFIIALATETAVAIFYMLHYINSYEKHYFVVLDENGEVVAIKTQRIKKSTAKSINVKLEDRVYEISPIKRYHIISNFADTEIKLIDTKEAKAKAEAKIRQSSMLDLTVRSLTQLFRSTDLLFLLLIIAVALSAANIVITLLRQG
ncbi:MAG: hypothetical protein ABIK73_08660 [candidate division WOR-3 bacterium]